MFAALIILVQISQIFGYGYPYMPYQPYQNPYQVQYPVVYPNLGLNQNPYHGNQQGFNPYGGNPYMNSYPGFGSIYPTYVQNYGMIPIEIIDEPSSKELMEATVKVLVPTSHTNNINIKHNGTSPMLPKENGPYGYIAPPPFRVSSINTTNDVKSSYTGPIQTSSISKSEPSQTIITRTLDPKTGSVKVDIKTDAKKMDETRNSTDIKVRTPLFSKLSGSRKEDNGTKTNGTRSLLRNRGPTFKILKP